MSEETNRYATMSPKQLLEELAQLETERDALLVRIGAHNTSPDETTRTADLSRLTERIKQIGEVLAKQESS